MVERTHQVQGPAGSSAGLLLYPPNGTASVRFASRARVGGVLRRVSSSATEPLTPHAPNDRGIEQRQELSRARVDRLGPQRRGARPRRVEPSDRRAGTRGEVHAGDGRRAAASSSWSTTSCSAFDPADGVDWAKMERVPDRVLDRPALAANQAVIVAHRGREHAHVHLLVNRVHPDTDRAGSGGRTGRASSRCCARRRTS